MGMPKKVNAYTGTKKALLDTRVRMKLLLKMFGWKHADLSKYMGKSLGEGRSPAAISSIISKGKTSQESYDLFEAFLKKNSIPEEFLHEHYESIKATLRPGIRAKAVKVKWKRIAASRTAAAAGVFEELYEAKEDEDPPIHRKHLLQLKTAAENLKTAQEMALEEATKMCTVLDFLLKEEDDD